MLALHTGDRPPTLTELGNVEPAWWHAPIESMVPAPAQPARRTRRASAQPEPSLFDPVPGEEPDEGARPAESSPADRVLASAVFKDQVRLAGQIRVTESQIRSLVAALLAAPSRELTLPQAAGLLALSVARVKGALLQVKRVLDVEGYEVLLLPGDVVRLDEPLLREQFGLGP